MKPFRVKLAIRRKLNIMMASIAVSFGRLRAFSVLCIILSNSSVSAQPDVSKLSSVADLRYGMALYEYFQSDLFSAISTLMVADAQGGIQGHANHPQIISGGINLAFGMEQRANEIFSNFLAENPKHPSSSAAWFHLANIRFQRGEYNKALLSLDKIQEVDSKSMLSAADQLRLQILLKQNKINQAQSLWSDLHDKNGYSTLDAYAQYNLGIHFAKQGDLKQAHYYFENNSKQVKSKKNRHELESHREESLTIYDRTLTAYGYTYFQQEDYDKAIEQFSNVRLQSDFSTDAILGLGWSRSKLDDHSGALDVWRYLIESHKNKNRVLDSAILEAYMAVAKSHLEMNDTQGAIKAYQEATTLYASEINKLDRFGSQLMQTKLASLLNLNHTDSQYSWLVPEINDLINLPSVFLKELFSSRSFQKRVQETVELNRIQQKLQIWKENLSSFEDLMQYRLKTFRNDQAALQDTHYNSKEKSTILHSSEALDVLQATHDRLSIVIEKARAQRDVFALLDEDRLDLLEQIQSAEKNATFLSEKNEDVEEETQWVKRYKGLLFWSANQDFDQRIWSAQSTLLETQKLLMSSKNTHAAIQGLVNNAPDIASAMAKITQYSERIETILEKNKALMKRLETNIRAQINRNLSMQRQALKNYLAQSQLAIAKIYDTSYLQQNNIESSEEGI